MISTLLQEQKFAAKVVKYLQFTKFTMYNLHFSHEKHKKYTKTTTTDLLLRGLSPVLRFCLCPRHRILL